MANDSRSTSNVQLIASSQGGQMKLKIPRSAARSRESA